MRTLEQIIAKDNKDKTNAVKIRTVHARRDAASLISDENVLYLNENKKEPVNGSKPSASPCLRGEPNLGSLTE